MKIRLFLAALCLFLLPLCFAGTSPQFSAYASGYVIAYGEIIPCECDGSVPECICDGESLTNPESNTANQSGTRSAGSEALFALVALMLWLRLKA